MPATATATNSPNSGDQQTDRQGFASAVLRFQFIPSGLVITRFVPLFATATNSPNSGDQQTDRQEFATAALRPVQLEPTGLGSTRL